MTLQTESASDEFSGREGAAIVTGASGAVGSAACAVLAARGSDLAVTYASRESAAEDALAEPRRLGRATHSWKVDLSDAAAARRFVEEVLDRFGAVHTLVHAAGPHVNQVYLSEVEPAQLQLQLDREVTGFFNVVHPLIPALRKSRGSIVAITSVAVQRTIVRDALSAGPKGAVVALVRAFALEEGRFGIRANCVAPGILRDGIAARLIDSGELDDASLTAAMARIPLGEFGSAASVAEAACFLASARAGYVTGQTLAVDGGYCL